MLRAGNVVIRAGGCAHAILMISICCTGRGEKRSRPPSPSRPERSEPSQDRFGPRSDAVANGRPLPVDDRRVVKRLAVNLLPDAGSAPPRDVKTESGRGNDGPKRSHSPQDAKPDVIKTEWAPPPGLSPDNSRGSSPAMAADTKPPASAVRKTANGSAPAATFSGGAVGRREGSPPPASGASSTSSIWGL